MFFKNKSNNEYVDNSRRISVANLYLCVLGRVLMDQDGYYIIDSKLLNKPYAILELKKGPNYKDHLEGISPIYNVSYQYFYESVCREYIGQVMMFRTMPLIQLDGIDRKYYSILELTYLENQLNKKEREQNVIDDAVMQEIKKAIDAAMDIFSQREREEILSKLNSLGTFYVSELINIRSNKNRELTVNDPEKALIEECSKQLVDIESETKELLINSSLQEDLETLKKCLKDSKKYFS